MILHNRSFLYNDIFWNVFIGRCKGRGANRPSLIMGKDEELESLVFDFLKRLERGQ